ncbi:unnamed protein product [Phytophthora fragariaefolia]|uniref:Unnamed protein product n=1 Tax=Phytophthora fragariaefolia TaxID=1490495 RepID=A0A9W7D4I6_9STRA|nr:unnamed protein product [Phytophthora fragariaefolia]
MRIRRSVARKFAVPLEELPSLVTFQNYVNHFARTQLDNPERVDDIRKWVDEKTFTEDEGMTEPFTFTWESDVNGNPVVGDGSDESPFIVGRSTKGLMVRLAVPPEHFVLHIDATYKLNRLDYPVIVVGVSDRPHGFHLVAFFVVSQEVEDIYTAALRR